MAEDSLHIYAQHCWILSAKDRPAILVDLSDGSFGARVLAAKE